MIVTNTGYKKLEDVQGLGKFSIYCTHKNTHILVMGASCDNITLYQPKHDRLPWKLTEGSKICSGKKVFDSTSGKVSDIDTTKWNNCNQIMTYKEFTT
jgi:hypothetical protein